METSTSKVVAYLKKQEPGYQFTRRSLQERLEDEHVSQGAVSGIVHRLHQNGNIRICGKGLDGGTVYKVVDMDNVRVRNTSTNGGKAGRLINSRLSSKERLISVLSMVIEDLHKIKTGLDGYSTDELLKEIKRRTAG